MNIHYYDFIKEFLDNNYLDYLTNNNVTIVHFTQNTGTTFLMYKDEIFIFESTRSLNKAYAFYHAHNSLYDEGMEYYKITRNFTDYMDINDVRDGETFRYKNVNYLINYYSKGFQNKKKMNLRQVDNRMFYLVEYCDAVIQHGLMKSSDVELTSVVTIKNKVNYQVDMFPLHETTPKPITNKYKVNKELVEVIENKEYSNLKAYLGIFFIDGYKDCERVDNNRAGGYIYYALEDYNLILRPFTTISLNEIYTTMASLLEEVDLPISITTDNDFLYDIFKKSFNEKIDFILDKSNIHNRFLRELSITLTANNYEDYGFNSYALILENNYNEISSYIDKASITDYESLLRECINSYKLENMQDDEFETYDDNNIFEDYLEALDEEFEEMNDEYNEEEDFKLDTDLLS